MTAAVTLYGADSCRFTNRTRGQLDSLGVPYDFVDLEKTGNRRFSCTGVTPTVEIRGGDGTRRLLRPGDWELEVELIRCGVITKRAERPASRSVIRGSRSVLGRR